VICANESTDILLPQTMALISNNVEMGQVIIDYQCTSLDSSNLIVSLNLSDGNNLTGSWSLKLLTPNQTPIENVEVFNGELSTTVRLQVEGSMLFELVAEINGREVTLRSENDTPSFCYECGDSAAYFADPDGYLENGFRVNAYSDDDVHTTDINAARYMHTGLHDLYDNFDSTFVSDEVGTCLIIQENNTLTPYSNSMGGNITFNFTEPDDFFEFQLFNIHVGATLHVFTNDGVSSIRVDEAINDIQNIAVTLPETEMVTIEFDGPGAICGIKSCIEGDRPKSDPNNNPPSETIAPTVSPEPSSVPSSQPTNCYEKYGITEEDIINQIGSNDPIPEDAVHIIEGQNTNVTIQISQLWSNDANVSFFIQYHSETHDTVCEGIPDFSYEDTLIKDLECYDGWTDVGIFIYFDDELTLEECEECKQPDSDEDNIFAYYFELPCEPICESLAPTRAPATVAPTASSTRSDNDCYDQYTIGENDLISQVGSNDRFPENAVKIISGENANVTIEISQLWSDNANVSFFVHYHSGDHGTLCEGFQDFSFEDTIVKDLECYDGYTDVGIFVYLDSNLTLEECEACVPPESDEEDIIAYYFELPCEPICETLAPSAAPTDCYDKYGITEDDILDRHGANRPIPEDAVKIVNGENVNVTIQISQLWSEDTNTSIFIQYHSQDHESVCEGIQDFSYEDTLTRDLECYDGWTDVGIFIYFDDELTLEECEECKQPDSDDTNVVAYYFELPCEPICESLAPTNAPTTIPRSSASEESKCDDGILMMTKDTGGDSMCDYGSQPLIVEAVEDDNSGSNEVRFSFTNNWDDSMNVELFYDKGDGLGQQCQSLNLLSKGAMYPNTLAAACDPMTKTADIEVYISNGNIDHTSSLGQCGESEVGSCSYVYKIPCSADVACDDERRLEGSMKDTLNTETAFDLEEGLAAEPSGFMTDEMKAAAEPSDDLEDGPYCVHKDYPCEGDEDDMVYVCHYSSRAGYQTFCIPEMDSDILRFNKNHHCGPCDGWNGEKNIM